MSIREELHREIDNTPDDLLPKVVDFVQHLRESKEGSSSAKKREALDRLGRSGLPTLSSESLDRGAIYGLDR